jgi:predicted ATP-grasp superfamily ATP-dependent carboligase
VPPLATIERDISPDAPAMVVFLEGWIDAGGAGALARAALVDQIPNQRFASFDGDALIDYRARRPTMALVDGVIDEVRWPEIELRAGVDRAGHDVLLLVGPEPDMRWHAFAAEIVTLAQRYGVRMVVGLGAFPAPVPHTRAVRLASTASSVELAAQVGFVGGTLEVPSGIQGVLERAAGDAGIAAVGLWARVPHYLAATPYPAAAAALIDGLASTAGLTLHSGDLHAEAAAARSRIDDLVANSAEHRSLIGQLEAQVDAEEPTLAVTLPSGDELAAELERFLREQPEN